MNGFIPYIVAAAVWAAIMLVFLILHFVVKRLSKRARKLRLFLLEREGGCHGDVMRFVILAEDEEFARHIAEREGKDHRNPNLWLETASCDEIDTTVPQIVLRDILEEV